MYVQRSISRLPSHPMGCSISRRGTTKQLNQRICRKWRSCFQSSRSIDLIAAICKCSFLLLPSFLTTSQRKKSQTLSDKHISTQMALILSGVEWQPQQRATSTYRDKLFSIERFKMQYIEVRSAGKDALALKSIVIYGLKYQASSASDAILLPVYEPSWFSAFFQSF